MLVHFTTEILGKLKLLAPNLCIVFIAMIACSAQDRPAAADKRAADEIKSALSNWVGAANRRDTAAANSIWEKNVIGWFPAAAEFSPAEAFKVAGLTPKRDASYSTYELKIDEVAVFGSMASVYDIWTETHHFEGSPITVTRVIRSSELWKRQPGGAWKIVRWVSAPEKWMRGQ